MTTSCHVRTKGSKPAGRHVVDGRLVESLHVEEARRLVALAEAIAARG